MYNDELDFEKDFIQALVKSGWVGGVLSHPTEKELIDNWATILFNNNKQIDRLNNVPLSDGEMQQLIDKITELKTPYMLNNFINGKDVSIVRDNPLDPLHKGKEISLKIYDRNEIAAGSSKYQIAEQPIFNKSYYEMKDRRGDLMLLINGMPLFHIELKRSNTSIKQATTQIEKYSSEGIFSKGIFQLVQIFVAMTPEKTLYFANPGPNKPFNPSFFFQWEDINNEIINDWRIIANTLLSIPMAHQLIGFYTVADDMDQTLKVMRSYQYYAANKISDIVSNMDWTAPSIRAGYVWHTTGSGKTMTSFKSAQLIANSKDADKVIFLMDRVELGTQSLDDYKGFADDRDDVIGTEDTEDLVSKLRDDNNVLIVTSIQKMSLIKKYSVRYQHFINEINRKRIVIIVDECHRDTFGEMMFSIREIFPKAIFFGFTGTPITDENKKHNSVTSDIFGNELCRYTIADGMRDGNVLGFDKSKIITFNDKDIRKAVALDMSKSKSEDEALSNPEKCAIYYKYMNDIPMAGYEDSNGDYVKGIEDYIKKSQYNNPVHRNMVVKSIMDEWKLISRNNEFSGIFATSSIPEAIEYYRLFKQNNALDLFKFTVLVDPNIDNIEDLDRTRFKEEGLIEIVKDYNEMYNQQFTLSTMDKFKKDVSNRLAHKKPYTRINDNEKLGLLIVVDQMLTGFDSKWLNVLYLDKILQYENIIQAFSRTNRVYDINKKPFGIIKYCRKPYTMEKNIDKAIKTYSGDKPFQLFVPKLSENLSKMNEIFKEIEDLFNECSIENFSELPENKEDRKKFISLYNDFNKYLTAARIQGYIPKNEENELKLIKEQEELNNIQIESTDYSSQEKEEMKEKIFTDNLILESPITSETIDALKQRYVDISKDRHTKEDEDIAYEIDGTLIEIDDGKIDYDYMNSKFVKYLRVLTQSDSSKEEIEKTLDSLHKSFASLSREQQKYANMIIHDIESNELIVEEGKSFIDYINDYMKRNENDQIKKLSIAFGLNENKLRDIMKSYVTESNINEFGRFQDLIDTVDKSIAKKSLEEYQGRELRDFEVGISVDKILRQFILEGGFDIEELLKKD